MTRCSLRSSRQSCCSWRSRWSCCARLRLAAGEGPHAGNLDLPVKLVAVHTAAGTLGIVGLSAYQFLDLGWV